MFIRLSIMVRLVTWYINNFAMIFTLRIKRAHRKLGVHFSVVATLVLISICLTGFVLQSLFVFIFIPWTPVRNTEVELSISWISLMRSVYSTQHLTCSLGLLIAASVACAAGTVRRWQNLNTKVTCSSPTRRRSVPQVVCPGRLALWWLEEHDDKILQAMVDSFDSIFT